MSEDSGYLGAENGKSKRDGRGVERLGGGHNGPAGSGLRQRQPNSRASRPGSSIGSTGPCFM